MFQFSLHLMKETLKFLLSASKHHATSTSMNTTTENFLNIHVYIQFPPVLTIFIRVRKSFSHQPGFIGQDFTTLQRLQELLKKNEIVC